MMLHVLIAIQPALVKGIYDFTARLRLYLALLHSASAILPTLVMRRISCVEQEATEAIKPILGKYYAKDTRNVWRALWEDWDACHYAAPDAPGSGVFWFHR